MKIICIGRNYVDHAGAITCQNNLFFVKPDTALLRTHMFYLPPLVKMFTMN